MLALLIRFDGTLAHAQQRPKDDTIVLLLQILLPQNGVVGVEERFEGRVGRFAGAVADVVQ